MDGIDFWFSTDQVIQTFAAPDDAYIKLKMEKLRNINKYLSPLEHLADEKGANQGQSGH